MMLGSGCWHSGWAEIKIRRPSGNTGWMMSLQNRPHPLSLTHPSSLSIPESELGLLASTYSPEGGEVLEDSGEGAAAMFEWGGVKEKGVEVEEEYFFSTEIGSFTDITFASRIPSSHAHVTDAGHVTGAAGHVTGAAGHVTDAGHVTGGAGHVTGGAGHVTGGAGHVTDAGHVTGAAGHVTDSCHVTGSGHLADEKSETVEPSDSATTTPKPNGTESELEIDSLKGERGDGGDDSTAEKDESTKLTITEAAAIMYSDTRSDQKPQSEYSDPQSDQKLQSGYSDPQSDRKPQSGEDSQEDNQESSQEGEDTGPCAAYPPVTPAIPSALGGVIAHVKRTANSQSWSEDAAVTSPVAITPRPSSYSFSMQNLPPLLSYDGGEEFSHSPSLNEGGAVLSEEEQVRKTIRGWVQEQLVPYVFLQVHQHAQIPIDISVLFSYFIALSLCKHG